MLLVCSIWRLLSRHEFLVSRPWSTSRLMNLNLNWTKLAGLWQMMQGYTSLPSSYILPGRKEIAISAGWSQTIVLSMRKLRKFGMQHNLVTTHSVAAFGQWNHWYFSGVDTAMHFFCRLSCTPFWSFVGHLTIFSKIILMECKSFFSLMNCSRW